MRIEREELPGLTEEEPAHLSDLDGSCHLHSPKLLMADDCRDPQAEKLKKLSYLHGLSTSSARMASLVTVREASSFP